jgi:voltage-gated potassium channel
MTVQYDEPMAKLRKSAARAHRVLYTKAPVSAERTLVNRALLVLVLVGFVMALMWLDRDGLKDHIDGHVSFSDVVYFTMITVATVGYGDIVPVSDRARIIDALLVTPVRIFVWFIFLGTAYQFVFQKIWEGIRMSRLKDRLVDHVVICGYGQSGTVAAREIEAKGTPAERIVVIDISEDCVRAAAESGYVGLHGDPTQERILKDASIERANAAIVSLGRDDTTILAVLTIRYLNPGTRIVATIWEEENAKLAVQAGANSTVLPSEVNGYLLAESATNRYTADYVLDMLNSAGRVAFRERVAAPDEVGKAMKDIADGLVVRLYRDGEPIGFWEKDKGVIRAGDLLLVIEPTLPA